MAFVNQQISEGLNESLVAGQIEEVPVAVSEFDAHPMVVSGIRKVPTTRIPAITDEAVAQPGNGPQTRKSDPEPVVLEVEQPRVKAARHLERVKSDERRRGTEKVACLEQPSQQGHLVPWKREELRSNLVINSSTVLVDHCRQRRNEQ